MTTIRVRSKEDLLKALDDVQFYSDTKILVGTLEYEFTPENSKAVAMARAEEQWYHDYKKKLRIIKGRIRRLPKHLFEDGV